MKTEIKYEGKNYKFKKNSINKMKQKYDPTYHYILIEILKYKKYIKEFQKISHMDDKNSEIFNKLLLKAIESTAKDLKVDNKRIYSYNKFNRIIIKSFNKELKQEKKTKINNNLEVIKLYKKIEMKEYNELRKIALEKPNDFLKALYLYTICED